MSRPTPPPLVVAEDVLENETWQLDRLSIAAPAGFTAQPLSLRSSPRQELVPRREFSSLTALSNARERWLREGGQVAAITDAPASTSLLDSIASPETRESPAQSAESLLEHTDADSAHSPDLLLVAPEPLHLVRATTVPVEQEQSVLREEAREAHRFARRKRGAEERSAREARSAEEESARVKTLSSPFVSELAGEGSGTYPSLESAQPFSPEQNE